MIYILLPVSFFVYLFLYLLEFYNTEQQIEDKKENEKENIAVKVVEEVKYEDKYWDKYNNCPEEYMFSKEDENIEQVKYEELLKENADKFEENEIKSDEEIKKEAHEYMKNKFLLKFKNSYIMENSPLGNVSMCYNHEKESFEYYSDKTIPYRYLEPIARKYVVTFFCKQLYVNMEDKLNEAKKRKEEEDQKMKEEAEKEKEIIQKTKDVFARLKSYNKDSKVINKAMGNKKNTVPDHIKTQLVSKIQSSSNPNSNNTQLLKECANRYTHQGRFVNFMILKTVNRAATNKNYTLTYAEFLKKNRHAFSKNKDE